MADYKERLGDFLRSRVDSAAKPDDLRYILDNTNGSTDAHGAPTFDQGDDLGDIRIGLEKKPLLDSPEAILGSYAAFWQKHANMQFRVADGSEYAAPSNRGDPLVYAENQGVEKLDSPGPMGVVGDPRVFVTVTNPSETIGATLSQYSNSGKFDEANPSQKLSQIVDKLGRPGRGPDIVLEDGTVIPNGPDGNLLLSSIEGREANTTGETFPGTDPELLGDRAMPQAATKILRGENKFHPGIGNNPSGASAFIEKNSGVTTSTLDSTVGLSSQQDFGKFDKDADQVRFENLKQLGLSLLIQAAGYNYNSSDPSDEAAGFRSKILQAAENNIESEFPEGHADKSTGVLINNRSMQPSAQSANPLRNPDHGLTGQGEFVSPGSGENFSFGSMNTPETPFSGPRSAGLINAQAAAAIVLMGKAISTLSASLLSATASHHIFLGRGPYYKGENAKVRLARSRLLRNLLFVNTEMPYDKCVTLGVELVFGSATDFEKIKTYPNISQSAGYYLTIARAILRSTATLEKLFVDSSNISFSGDSIGTLLDTIGQSKIVGILNALATIGNVAFMRNTGDFTKPSDADVISPNRAVDGTGPFPIDKFPNTPATRVMKSRDGEGFTNMSLAWRGSSVPAIYMIPKNILRTQIRMGTNVQGTSPTRGMLMSSLANKTYIDGNMEGSNARIPGDIVERMENALDAEYVPFYFHDLRTNEIVSFHAFLSTLTDGYTVNHTETGGYGRIDKVQTYNSTSRAISFDFYVVATSQDDFDEMWFKINKLVTLAYPQWTKGTAVEGEKEGKFVQPFSQILGSSPILRLRIGDVIKSNYSKFHLARLFGIGEKDTNVTPFLDKPDPTQPRGAGYQVFEDIMMTIFQAAIGTPLQWINGGTVGGRILRSAGSQFLINGFANPITILQTKSMRDPDSVYNPAPLAMNLQSVGEGFISMLNKGGGNFFGYHAASIVFIKPTVAKPYVDSSGCRWRFDRPIRGMVMSRTTVVTEDKGLAHSDRLGTKNQNFGKPAQKTVYTVAILDFTVPASLFGTEFFVTHSDLVSDPNNLFAQLFLPLLDPLGTVKGAAQFIINEAALALGVPVDTVQVFATDDARFMSVNNNAIVKSFAATRGRGLAGVFTNLSFDWISGDETPWEIDWNSRAPKIAKVSVSFTPIHDIPPGLGHDGFNRAPIYNVGRVMDSVAGDPYDDFGLASKQSFGNANRATFRTVGKDSTFKPEDK
tara:strand:+ start:1015 stop:4674 length:3660 start_codon:yes stop_codon:yes gene_type:complete